MPISTVRTAMQRAWRRTTVSRIPAAGGRHRMLKRFRQRVSGLNRQTTAAATHRCRTISGSRKSVQHCSPQQHVQHFNQARPVSNDRDSHQIIRLREAPVREAIGAQLSRAVGVAVRRERRACSAASNRTAIATAMNSVKPRKSYPEAMANSDTATITSIAPIKTCSIAAPRFMPISLKRRNRRKIALLANAKLRAQRFAYPKIYERRLPHKRTVRNITVSKACLGSPHKTSFR